ncbi:MAG: GNAT family N-acetyltransferase [Chloroflexia bacterium]
MWRVNASVYRRDLWSVIDLTRPRKISRHHARAIRKGGARVAVRRDAGDEAYSELHRVVVDSLARRHGVKPVHTLDELRLLRDLFPDSIDLWIAEDHLDMVVAAVWVFRFQSRCWHAQYIAADLAGMELNATHLVLESIANAALAESVQYFSMGCGTEDGGAILNAGLFDFKSGFGFGSVIQDFYRIDLTSL